MKQCVCAPGAHTSALVSGVGFTRLRGSYVSRWMSPGFSQKYNSRPLRLSSSLFFFPFAFFSPSNRDVHFVPRYYFTTSRQLMCCSFLLQVCRPEIHFSRRYAGAAGIKCTFLSILLNSEQPGAQKSCRNSIRICLNIDFVFRCLVFWILIKFEQLNL